MKILVVDREQDFRGVVDILEKTPGNDVQFASTGQEALDLVEGKHVNLLITEVFIEPMNGFTLRNKMENRHGGIRTIFLTGYDLNPYKEHTAGYEVVSKPATPQKLFPAITRALGFAVAETPPAPVVQPQPEPEPTPEPVATPTAELTQMPLPSEEFAAPPAAAVPVAVPRAVPVAVPVAVPRATPAATPVATPRAVPAATPVATPRAVPAQAAAPVATPRAIPAATPVAVPRATPAPAPAPVATPRATPAAVPRATAAPPPTPSAAPTAKPVATPTAVPKATPVAVPRASAVSPATPVATPRATPTATPVATPRPAVAAVPVVAQPADPLIGKTFGSYRIERRLGAGKWGPVYMAIQTSMNRPVAMELLSAESAGDEAARQNFVATARAKAAVQHPHILSVYEADQADGRYFYTHEYVDGLTLAQLLARGEGLSEPTALQTIKYVSQGLAHLHHHRVGHSIPEASDIYIGSDGLPYLSNVALPSESLPPVQEEIRTLGAVVRSVLPGGQAQDRGLQAMLMRMSVTTQAGFQSWPALFQAIQAIEPKVIPVDAFKLSAQDQAAIRAVEAARKRQKMQLILTIAGSCVSLCLILFLAWWNFLRPTTHDYSDVMVQIPSGQFIYQDGQKVILPDFYINKYEVTMAEYEKFLEYVAAHGNTTEYDSPEQPQGLSHIPHDWDIYYGRASSSFSGYRTVRGVPLSLDCPVFNVNYFDAYAYAKWKGRRLPTEQEWEKAARGPSGNLYPWGNEWDPAKLNAGGDYQSEPPPGYKPAVDGFTWWAPVDAFKTDSSPYGVIGMGGNVSEWTNSWDPGKTQITIRGGNFKSSAEKALTTAAIKAYPTTFAETLGFRTASDKPPGQ